MSRCEIAAVWFPDRRMKTEGGGGAEEWWRGATPWTDRLHRAALAHSLPRKQSSRCSLAAGVSLPQQWSLFNEPSRRTCILLPRLSSEVQGDALPSGKPSGLNAHSRVRMSSAAGADGASSETSHEVETIDNNVSGAGDSVEVAIMAWLTSRLDTARQLLLMLQQWQMQMAFH